MYVYISYELEVAIRNNAQQQQRILGLKEQIEQGDPLLFGLLFSPRHPYWVKRIGINYRLIAAVVTVNNEQVLYLINLLLRGGHEYRSFLDDPQRWGRQNIRINQFTLETWLTEQRQELPKPEIPLMPGILQPWLQKPDLLNTGNGWQGKEQIVFESREWVELWQRSDAGISAQGKIFHLLLCHLLAIAKGNYGIYSSSRYPHLKICHDPDSSNSIVYYVLQPGKDKDNDREIYFLLAPYRHRPTEIDIGKLGASLKLYGTTCNQDILDNAQETDDLARYARRSYPSYIVWDLDTWEKLERETEANLALSGEEEELLHGMRFPAFINGRAGSGKSTMLHYAFAYYCHLYLREINQLGYEDSSIPPFRPLFLTYSDRLTRRAKDVVYRILSSHAHYCEHSHTHLNEDNLEQLDECFQPFQQFLLNRLSPGARKNFKPNQYISFYRFKQLFNHSFPNSRYSCETCWHAIRTYIKGFNFADDDHCENVDGHHDYLSLAEYQDEVYQSHKSIADGVFEEIYSTVWKWYQNLQKQNGYWDDQDLVRAVLFSLIEGDQNGQSVQYAAIFCDEAQDFTRIELQVILRLSIWTKYQLIPPVESLPFAFAGDPMQTLNPTGFNWTSFRASFYDRILMPLDPDAHLGLNRSDYNLLRELQQNYRSQASLVRLGNGVHLWRNIIFDTGNLKPQIPWWPDGHSRPQKGIISGQSVNLSVTELRKIINQGVMFLLPCDEGGEIEFLKNYPHGERLFPVVAQGEIPPNVYTSVAVKGMEFSPIVVFGFGEYFAKEFQERPLATDLNFHSELKLEYFLNKLYVAVSRSTEILGIVDTDRGDQLLWQTMGDSQQQKWLNSLSRDDHRQVWQGQIEPLGRGFNTRIFQESNPSQNAVTFLESGLERLDIQNLSSAAYYFERAQQLPEAEYCRTWIDRLEGRQREAGLTLMEITGLTINELNLDPIQDAWNCFWHGQHWVELKQWCQRYPQRPQSAWQTVAEFMRGEKQVSIKEQRQALVKMLEFCTRSFPDVSTLQPHINDESWQKVWQKYRQQLEFLIDQGKTDNSLAKILAKHYPAWSESFEHLALAGFEPDPNFALAALCAYQYQTYSKAIALWEQCQETSYRDNQNYYLAQANLSECPENFPWLRRAKKPEEMLQLWQDSPQQLTPKWETVLDDLYWALKQNQRDDLLMNLDWQRGLWLQGVQRFRQSLHNPSPQTDLPWRLQAIDRLAKDGRLNPNAIEREFDRRFQDPDREVLGLLDLDVQESQWVRVLIRLKRRIATEITDQDLASLEQYREQLRSSIFQLFFGDHQELGQQLPLLYQEQQQQRQAMEELIAGKIQTRLLNKELARFPKSYQDQGAEEADYQRQQWLNLARKSLVNFVVDATNNSNWPGDLENIEQAGLALERIGEFGPTLQFYERFRSHQDADVLNLTRSRWIETKLKQSKYFEQSNRPDQAERQKLEAQEMTTVRWKKLKVRDPKDKNLHRHICDQLESFSEEELQQVVTYLRFLQFERQYRGDASQD